MKVTDLQSMIKQDLILLSPITPLDLKIQLTTSFSRNSSNFFLNSLNFKYFSLKLQALMKVPTEQELNAKALPNHNYPSDHLPLMAFFEITKQNKSL